MTSLPIAVGDGFLLLVKKGDFVNPGTILATREKSYEVHINVSSVLGVTKKKAPLTLKKNPGDRIRKGDILASKKRLLGMKEDVIVSAFEGMMLRFDPKIGQLFLLSKLGKNDNSSSGESSHEQIVSPIDGMVEVCDNDKILLTTSKNVLVAKDGTGGEALGEIFALPGSIRDERRVQLHELGSDLIGKIVLGGLFGRDALTKAIGMGAAGVIGGSISEEDLSHVRERRTLTPIVTVKPTDAESLVSWQGRKAYVQGEQKTILLLQL